MSDLGLCDLQAVCVLATDEVYPVNDDELEVLSKSQMETLHMYIEDLESQINNNSRWWSWEESFEYEPKVRHNPKLMDLESSVDESNDINSCHRCCEVVQL